MRSNSIKVLFILLCLLITRTSYGYFYIPFSLTDTITKKVVSKGFLDSKVDYSALDSTTLDKTNKKAYLYNAAVVVYEDMKLTAGYIEIDFENHLVNATGIKDSTGNIIQRPIMEQGTDKFNAGEITYNFETKKGKIKDVITQQGDGYIHGRDIKKDSTNKYYVGHGKYTTCDLEHPHYYIGAKKIKIIPDDKIITGPACLYLADVPTPLALPFGFFPNKKGRASGILIPSYGESVALGFFLKDGGFYFGSGERVDLALRGDVYSNGSFAAKAYSNYKKRYKYNGGANVNYSRIIEGDPELPTTKILNTFFVRWGHQQDYKSHPSRRFSANVNAGSSSYNTYNGNVTGDYLANTFQSNISYSKTFGTPFNFYANARHSQNTLTKRIDVSLPELALTMNRIYPFKGSNSIGTKWYDKVGISATMNARNDISGTDSTIFTKQILKQMKNGVLLNAPISTSLNIFKYFTLTPVINTSGRLHFKTVRKTYNSDLKTVITDTIPETRMTYDYNASAGLSTRLYGDYFFKTKRLKQIRHVATPTISASYRPDFSESQYGYYKYVQIDSLQNRENYSIFLSDAPPAGESGVIGFSLNNSLEAKTLVKTDSGSTNKKIKLIESFNISTAYNIATKNYKWSPISLNGRTRIFNAIDINATGTLNPYQIDSLGRAVERYEWNNGRIGRLTSANLSMSTSLRSKEKTETKKTTNATEEQLEYINTHPEAYVDFNIPWNLNIYYNINYSKFALKKDITQSITFNGDISLTKKWKISLTSGYDLTRKDFTLTSVNIYRDLHCWEMRFNWVPFGLRQSFSIDINVKSSVLRDLKLSRRKDWYDYQYQ